MTDSRSPFLHVLQPLPEEGEDVLVVECVEDHAPLAAAPDHPRTAEQAQLMRDRRFAQPDAAGDVADTALRLGQRIEDPDARRVAKDPEDLGEACNVAVSYRRHVTYEQMLICYRIPVAHLARFG